MDLDLGLNADTPISEAVRTAMDFIAKQQLFEAATVINFFTMQYRPESDHYRRAYIEAGVIPPMLTWFLSTVSEKEVYAGCRVIRALAGSPNSPDLVAKFLEYVDVHIMNHILDHLRKHAEWSLDTLEQIVGSLMNSLRTSPPHRLLFIQGGGLPLLTGILHLKDVQKHPRLSLFTSYAILATTRDNGLHEKFREGTVLADTKLLLSHDNLQVRAVCMMILANLAQSFDDPADDVSLDVMGVRFIVDTLQETLHPVPNTYYGWKIPELVHALLSISSADTFKGFLVDAHAVPMLLEVLETPAQQAQWKHAIQALHNLCFHHSVEERARNSLVLTEPAIFKRLKALAHVEDSDVVRCVALLLADLSDLHSTLSVMESRTATPQKPPQSGAGAEPVSGETDEDEKFDVMLSYAWASQRVVLAIRDRLVALGLKIWIDVDFMGHNLIDSMALAVENSSVIVMCCSSAYKASPNCRREADYAAHLRKPTIIANMEDGYVPRGWLGLHVAGKIWCDFREESTERFDRGLGTLMRQLVELGVSIKGMLQRTPSGSCESKLDISPKPALARATSTGSSVGAPTGNTTTSDANTLPSATGQQREDQGRSRASTAASARSLVLSVQSAAAPTPPAVTAAASSPALAAISAPARPDVAAPAVAMNLVAPSPLQYSTARVVQPLPPIMAVEASPGGDASFSVLRILEMHGQGHIVHALTAAGISELALHGLRQLYRDDAKGFYELVQRHFHLSFVDALSLGAALAY